MLEILDAGFGPEYVPYLDGWALQRSIHTEVVAGTRPDTMIVLEHEAVYTGACWHSTSADGSRPRTTSSCSRRCRASPSPWSRSGPSRPRRMIMRAR